MSDSLLEQVTAVMSREQWRLAIGLCMAAPPSSLTLELLWNWAWAHYKLEQFKAAKELFEGALELQPDSPSALWGLGVVLKELKDLAGAKRYLRRSLELKDGSLARQILALALMEEGDHVSAEQVHLEGLKLKPTSRERLAAYGDFLSDRGREDEAKVQYARAEQARRDREPTR